ncbi:MAG: hypothetical protein KDD82_08595 [Planctomycetes bacterium]|nr:hypothetical protein [Planctomycetota bacterium]
MSWALLAGASVTFGQGSDGSRPARGLPAPPVKRDFATRVLEVWDEGKRPEVLDSGKTEVEFVAADGALLPSLAPDAAGSEPGPGAAQFVRLKLPAGELDVRRIEFASPQAAQIYAGYGVGDDAPALIEVRGSAVVLIQGPGLASASANGLAKLRHGAWSRAEAGLAPATPWSLVAVMVEGDYALVSRGGKGPVHDQLVRAREVARGKPGLQSEPSALLTWLDGEARETLSMLLATSARHVELYAAEGQGSFAMAESWERVEGLKAALRQILQRRIPAAPEGVAPAEWAALHRKARLGGASPHTTPVLLTDRARSVEVAALGSEGGPPQAGLTEGVEQGAAPAKD